MLVQTNEWLWILFEQFLLLQCTDAKKNAQYQTSLTQNYYNRVIIDVLIMHNEYPEAVVIDPD